MPSGIKHQLCDGAYMYFFSATANMEMYETTGKVWGGLILLSGATIVCKNGELFRNHTNKKT